MSGSAHPAQKSGASFTEGFLHLLVLIHHPFAPPYRLEPLSFASTALPEVLAVVLVLIWASGLTCHAEARTGIPGLLIERSSFRLPCLVVHLGSFRGSPGKEVVHTNNSPREDALRLIRGV